MPWQCSQIQICLPLDLFAAECGSTESDALLALNLSTVPLLASSLSAMGARQDRSSQAADAVYFPEVLGDSARI